MQPYVSLIGLCGHFGLRLVVILPSYCSDGCQIIHDGEVASSASTSLVATLPFELTKLGYCRSLSCLMNDLMSVSARISRHVPRHRPDPSALHPLVLFEVTGFDSGHPARLHSSW